MSDQVLVKFERCVKVVVSQEYVDQIIYLEENIKENKFTIGDLLVDLVDNNDGRKQEVCEYLQGATGLDWKTLSDYETTSRRWNKELRMQYAQAPYSLLRNADPSYPEDIAWLDNAVDNQMTARRALDIKYQRNTPLYVLKNIYGQLERLAEEDIDIIAILGLIKKKIATLEELP